MKNALIVLLLAMIPLAAHASKKAETREVDTSSYQTTSDDDESDEPKAISKVKLTSEEKRADKRFSLLAQPVGLTLPGTVDFVVGASAGYFVTPNLIVSLDFSTTVSYGLDGSYDGWGHDTVNTYGSHAKYFLVGSLYLKGGVFYRTMDSYNYTSNATSSSELYSHTYVSSGNEVAVDLAIGNQWQIHKFTIGCDWFTVAAPLIRTIAQQDGVFGFDSSNYEFTKLYLGIAF